MKAFSRFMLRPFEKIAGGRALLFGLIGIAISVALNYHSGEHYHGLLHYGPAPVSALWVYVAECLIVWLVPALLFYLCGVLLSKSRIRIIDALGTVAFAQLPLLVMNALAFTTPMQDISNLDLAHLTLTELIPYLQPMMWIGLILILVMAWMLIWLYNALKISCNLKGSHLIIGYIATLLISDIITRLLINLMYA
jgi:hypothetical protein